MDSLISWVQYTLFPMLELGVTLCIYVWLLLFAPAFVWRKNRPWIISGLLKTAYFTGFTCWVFSVIVAYRTLGAFWLIAGILLGGIGVLPVAAIGIVFGGHWSAIPDFAFAIGTVILPRALALWIVKIELRHHEESCISAH